jgi:hypothetical protein
MNVPSSSILDSLEMRSTDISVKPVDLVRRMDVYDGSPGDDDWHTPIKVPMGISRWDFTLAEIDRQSFRQLRDILGAENFQKIVSTQGYLHPDNEFQSYRGEDNLSLHYYIRATDRSDTRELIIVSFGEFQPARWIAHIEGFWQLTAASYFSSSPNSI